MSKKSIARNTVRELNAHELDQVSGGLGIRAGGVVVKQPLHPAYVVKRVTGTLNALIGKL